MSHIKFLVTYMPFMFLYYLIVLQEEMDKNRKTSSDVASDGFGTRTREVACPTCTVHLQVQVPASGSETIECSVCQHPFLVGAH